MVQALKYMIYGIISGLAEILPASLRGHQSLMMILFGMPERDPMLDLVVHGAILSCVLFNCRSQFLFLSGKSKQSSGTLTHYDRRLLISAMIPMLIALFFYNTGTRFEIRPIYISIFFLINGIILLIPDYVRQSNKTAGQMGPFDSLLIGLSGYISLFPGISRLGSGCCAAIVRGADRQQAFNWLLLLTVPAMVILIVTDLIGLFSIGLPGITLWLILGYVLSAAAAFAGSYIGILLMRFLTFNTGFSVFALYSFGASLFSFIIYLVAF